MIINQNFRRLCCSECAVVYYFPEEWCERATKDGRSWKCPNGHGQHFGDSEADKLRRERDLLAQRIAQKDDTIKYWKEREEVTERRLNATRGVVTRIKNRVGHGVCPCCNRTFGDLARHMAAKHADYAQEAAE